MGKVVETKKKKKKGRPSLLDLQKRNIREQQHHLHRTSNNSNSTSAPRSNPIYTPTAPPTTTATATANHNQPPLRRSTRRNPNPDDDEDDDDDSDGNGGVSDGKRREKKLKLVLKLPKSSANSASVNSGGSENDDDDNAASESGKKRKINAIGDGSGLAHPPKGDKSIPATNPSSSTHQGGAKLDSGPSTPLPNTKLLLFVLERLQKKDAYGVFSEPVDPEELPDYHEVIENPMDFGTVKKKLTSGAYASLEQFEDDIFLICSNAMQYNAPDTIYFRQARSIHELAKKNFENLRQDSDDNEPEPKVVRRGRPPTKNLKKPLGRPSLERAGSEFSDATLATGAENAILSNYDRSRSNDVYTSWLADNKFERNDDLTGSMLRGNSKTGRKQFVFDENRRNTYLHSHPSANGRESTVLTTFDGERKQLMPVGLQSDGYARSLARFAANLGPVAWRIAAQRIQRSLPAGVKFGPGWVGENDVAPHRPLVLASSSKEQPSSPQPLPFRANSSSATISCSIEPNKDKLSDKPSGHNLSEKHAPSISSGPDDHPSSPPPLSAATSSDPLVANRSPESRTGKGETVEGSNSRGGINMMNSNLGGIRPRPPFQIHRTPEIQPGVNGLNGTYGLNRPAQVGKQVGVTRPGGFSFQSSQMLDQVSRTNTNLTHPATSNSLNSEETKPSDDPGTKQSSGSYSNSVKNESLPARTSGLHPRSSWRGSSQQIKPNPGFSPQQKPDSVPPDLNVRFQSPGSPSSSRADSTQPDLALQL
ncbi:putative chromatin remodeler Bromodomain family [Rosa chinensis]|uniref:Putative chromatin remodeler Bromodomain family n=1 Tax=Rosa chinensis TaxID=74649 RepID=A0A2P6PTC8_ROSCH|nr:uncharacterized protein LOC112170307 [Rosa chinensis]PRQ25185.1 putative chromatin remodeler Bromodomain family [Rosa chinensis]